MQSDSSYSSTDAFDIQSYADVSDVKTTNFLQIPGE